MQHFHLLVTDLTNFRSLENVGAFAGLRSLVLDNNEISDGCNFPDLPSLGTLCMNNNNIKSIKLLLDTIRHTCPNLKYLSLLKNPCCPHRLIGMDDDDYSRYRLYVLWRLPNLTFLDSGRVTPAERAEASRRGEFCIPAEPTDVCHLSSFLHILTAFVLFVFYLTSFTQIVSSQTAIEASIGDAQEITESVCILLPFISLPTSLF